MKSQIRQALNKIMGSFGESAFTNARQFKAVLSDVPIETNAKKIRSLLNTAMVEMRAYSRLKAGFAKSSPFIVDNLINEMTEDYEINPASAKTVIESIAEELFGYTPVSVPVANTPPAPNPQQPLNPQPMQTPIDVDLLKQQLLTEIMGQISSDPQFSQKMPPQPLPTKNPGASSIPKIGSIIPFGGYDWRVLDVQNSKVLLITKDVIEKRKFDASTNNWTKCELRKYLNGAFYNSFDTSDKSRIVSFNSDNVFLLSVDEARKYFKNDSDRAAKYGKEASWWWLRSPGDYGDSAAGVLSDGSVYVLGIDFYDVSAVGGVRPALWLNL
ncbi:MAG: DUF6273 domain-containing protein [Oscillospiraceae bacterium]|nr:DUF6273 domain-containing protein [Oscillospiraceae bacterium]